MVRTERDRMTLMTSRSHGDRERTAVERCFMLRARILDAISGDDEFLEEIYLHCNYAISFPLLTAYRKRFRAGEIAAAVEAMCNEAIVERLDHEWTELQCDPILRATFQLTARGERMHEEVFDAHAYEDIFC